MRRLMILNLICGLEVNRIFKSIKYGSGHEVFIPFEGRMKSCLKIGDSFEKGIELFKVDKRKLLASYCLSEDLGIKPNKILEYVTRIEGEYISKDDVLAEKLVSGGLLSKRVVSEYDGIVNLSKSNLGYVNILSELGVESCISTFSGIVKDVDFAKGMLVKTDVCALPFFYSNFDSSEGVFGNLKILADESVPSRKNIQESFEGNIVFAGRFLYPELAIELFKRGCKFILASSMNYDDLKNLKVPVGILTGFGNIGIDSTRFDFLRELEGLQVAVSLDDGAVQFPVGLNSGISNIFEQNYYTVFLKKGDIVRSVDIESFGMVGEVENITLDGKLVDVFLQDGSKISVDMESLELYQEDFSIMRTRIFSI